VGESDVGDGLGVTGHELNDVLWETGFKKNVIDELTGVDVGGRGLPDNDVTHESRG
jgi:hypothetical protein